MIQLRGVCKSYPIHDRRVDVLTGINLVVESGTFLSIMGPSGSGKSTLLNIIGTLDRPDSGEFLFNGKNMQSASDTQLSRFRSRTIGFVFQNFNLIPGLSVLNNVKLPFLYASVSRLSAEKRALEAIESVGLAHRMDHKPSELSGGEMQRVAIARAIAIQPSIILADEPTGNLDSKTGSEILSYIKALHDQGATVIIITHDQQVADYTQQRIHLLDGRIAERL
ncbi:MAG: ABC transporter ATP-binding protein [Desulfobacteraceae bacterium]|nr:MAG: ABC transporter ATP-binding protein [Desulfobacteraceae bacterium]